MSTVTIEAFGRSYQIDNPGPGRVGDKLANREPYEKKLLVDIYQQGLTGAAFDIGAHIGNHTLYLAAICRLKVYAFEPHAASYQMLLDNLALNPGLEVETFTWACGRADARARFTTGRWLEFDPTRDGDTLTLERGHIPVHAIDEMLDVPDLAVVKVDVEGMEPDALAGMTRHLERSRPIVYAETHDQAAHRKIGEVLEPLGYEMTRGIHMGSTMERWQCAAR